MSGKTIEKSISHSRAAADAAKVRHRNRELALTWGTAMKRISLSIIGISGLLIAAPLSTANAADMALKAPPPPPAPIFSWTGFYVGAQAGGAWGRDNGSIVNPGIPVAVFSPFTVDTSGGMGGFHAGYNYQVSQWVFGLEGSVDWTRLDKTFTVGICPLFCGTATPKADTQASILWRV